MLAALQERTPYRPTTASALMKSIVRRGAWLIPRFRGNHVQSPFYRAMGGPYRGKLLEFGESLLAHLPDVGKESGNPAPKLADRWNPLCGWARVTSQTSIWSELTKELCMRAVYDDLPGRRRRLRKSHLQLNPSLFLINDQKRRRMQRKSQQENRRKTTRCRGEPVDTREAPGPPSSCRGEKRTETQENVPVKKRLITKSPKRPAAPVSLPDDPVKRRLLKKTDMQTSDVLMAVEINDTDLLHTVNTLLNDETRSPGEKVCRG